MTITDPIVLRSLTRGFGFSVVAGIIVAFLGPFGTFENLTLIWRLGFWVSAIVGGFLFHMPLYWLGRLIAQRKGWPIWIAIIGSAVIAALPTTFLVNGIAVSLLRSVTTDSVLTLYPMVLAISVPLQVIGHISAFKDENVADLPAQPVPAADDFAEVKAITEQSSPSITNQPQFFARLPGRIGKDLLCLQMEDHYVRAFTPLGSEMILMRMADAAKELEGVDGLLVHRSFWVSRAAVVGWRRDGKTLTLRLCNGKNVPVARDRQAQVKTAGWLTGVSD